MLSVCLPFAAYFTLRDESKAYGVINCLRARKNVSILSKTQNNYKIVM